MRGDNRETGKNLAEEKERRWMTRGSKWEGVERGCGGTRVDMLVAVCRGAIGLGND